jgi:hypothetical protein
MTEPPTRAELAIGERLARRVLSKNKDSDVRKLAKSILDFAAQADKYVENLYPCFDLLDKAVRFGGCQLGFDPDGVWRLRQSNGEIVITGTNLKDLCINMILWHSDSDTEAFLEECAEEEDCIFEPDRRKHPQN